MGGGAGEGWSGLMGVSGHDATWTQQQQESLEEGARSTTSTQAEHDSSGALTVLSPLRLLTPQPPGNGKPRL